MQDFIESFISQILLSILVSINSVTTDVLPNNTINLVENGTVVKVIDGDTIEVYENKKIEKVRLIGVNTPETVDPRKDVQCYGFEASMFLKKELSGQQIILEADNTQQEKDSFGRILRYVYLKGTNINKKIIEEGYGFEYTYKSPYKFQKEFKEAEEKAKKEEKGLWNKSNCNY